MIVAVFVGISVIFQTSLAILNVLSGTFFLNIVNFFKAENIECDRANEFWSLEANSIIMVPSFLGRNSDSSQLLDEVGRDSVVIKTEGCIRDLKQTRTVSVR